VAFDGETVYERNLAPSGMAGVGPVSGFEQNRFQQSDLDDFATYAFNLHPVAHADTVAAHQQKPSKERHDHVFAGDRKSGAGKANNFRGLAGPSENNECNYDRANDFRPHFGHGAKRVDALVLRLHTGEEAVD
jgi:hypothetical protein